MEIIPAGGDQALLEEVIRLLPKVIRIEQGPILSNRLWKLLEGQMGPPSMKQDLQ